MYEKRGKMPTKKIYLTIDDAPSTQFRKKIDYLIKKKISAILFCRGDLIKEREADLIYAVEKGFIIGNHSFSHQNFSNLSIKQSEKEIRKTDNLIDEIYFRARIKRKFKFFRFPYGNKGGKNKEKLQQILRKLGYSQPNFQNINYPFFRNLGLNKDADVFWTFDFEEYKSHWLKILSKIKREILEQGGSLQNKDSVDIVLIHDHEETSDLFFKIIDILIDMKVNFKELK